MPISQGRNVATGQDENISLGKYNDQLVSGLHGKYAAQAMSGNLHYMSTLVAGLAIPISTTTAPTVMLWNPPGSGVDGVLCRYTAGHASGDAVAGTIGLVSVSNFSLNAAVAGTSAVTVFADNVFGTNLFNAKHTGGQKAKIRNSSQGTNTIIAGTWIKALGLDYHAVLSTSVVAGSVFQYDFDGEVVLPQGTAVFVAANAASVALFAQTLSWYEVPSA